VTTTFFAAIEPASAAFPVVERLRSVVAAAGLLTADSGAVQAELRVRVVDGVAEVRRFYWSVQHDDPESPYGVAARTVSWGATDPGPRTFEFPAEPVLTWLADVDGPLRGHGPEATASVLRYIPLRRVTFRLTGVAGLPQAVIGKAKRADGLRRAASAFRAVHEAAAGSAVRVPQVLRLDLPRHLLCLEHLPGRPLEHAAASLGLASAMEQLGRLHHELHELDVRGLPPRRGTADWLADARRAAATVALLVPSAAHPARLVHEALLHHAPADDATTYCQGDMAPDQVLCDPSGWSVVDLDDSHLADPLSEVAALYAGLAHDLGLPADQGEPARRAYLDAYAAHSGRPLDQARFRWFLTMVELCRLAHRLSKARAAPGEAQQVLDRLARDW
jgi:aminoglycoside phosphotransferase (APT) family kinase protein